MQPRSRTQKKAITTRKISISLTEDDLAVLKREAARSHGGNVSAVVQAMIATLRRGEAIDRFLDRVGAKVSDEEVQAIRDEIAGRPPRRKRRRAA